MIIRGFEGDEEKMDYALKRILAGKELFARVGWDELEELVRRHKVYDDALYVRWRRKEECLHEDPAERGMRLAEDILVTHQDERGTLVSVVRPWPGDFPVFPEIVSHHGNLPDSRRILFVRGRICMAWREVVVPQDRVLFRLRSYAVGYATGRANRLEYDNDLALRVFPDEIGGILVAKPLGELFSPQELESGTAAEVREGWDEHEYYPEEW